MPIGICEAMIFFEISCVKPSRAAEPGKLSFNGAAHSDDPIELCFRACLEEKRNIRYEDLSWQFGFLCLVSASGRGRSGARIASSARFFRTSP